MVVYIRDLENIASFTPNFHSTIHNMASNNDINIVINPFNNLFENISNNFDEVRGRSLVLSTHYPRTSSMSSSNYNKDYVQRIQRESNRIVKDNPVTTSDSV